MVDDVTGEPAAPATLGVLLVDDEPNVVSALRRQLYRQFELYTALSGEQALELLSRAGDQIAVVVSDMRMPGMDGLTLLKEVQQRWPEVIRVMLTGNADQQTAINAVNQGQVFRFLTKPCPAEPLAAALQASLRQFRLHQAERRVVAQAQAMHQALARERELSAAQRQLVSMVSHEFRTPLAVIDSSVELLDGPYALTPEQAGKRLKQIRTSVRRLDALVESTLNLSRLEEGRLQLALQEIAPAALIEKVCQRQREITPGHEIVVRALALPDALHADPRLLDHVLGNLLSNAVKYSPHQTPVEVYGLTEDGQAVIVVRDQGVGIPDHELARLGQRFFRASSALNTPGTGLGLYLARQIVELHGGTLAIASTLGQGTTVAVRLPLAGPPPAPA